MEECKGRLKCVFVGDGAVGKTSLLHSYTTNGYPTEYFPTAFDNYNVVVNVDNQPILFQLCDTAGQDDFDSLRPLCYPSTDVFVVCFSVVSPTSFNNVAKRWMPEIRRHSADATPIIFVGTQSDLRSDVKVLIDLARYGEKPVSELDAKRLANRLGARTYVESSALTQRNLKQVFDEAILAALERSDELRRVTVGRSRGNRLLRSLTNCSRRFSSASSSTSSTQAASATSSDRGGLLRRSWRRRSPHAAKQHPSSSWSVKDGMESNSSTSSNSTGSGSRKTPKRSLWKRICCRG